MSPTTTIHAPPRTLPDSVSLAEFLDQVAPLSLADRYQLVEQASLLLSGAYVHLPLKRAMHAVDPIQRLRLLERRLSTLSEPAFHAELSDIFGALGDLHTVYQLPDPYRGRVATLGFLVERYIEDDTSHHVVTKVDPALAHAGFEEGSEIVAWNGVPIARAIERNAERRAGSNPEARLARGLEALTLRPLRTGPPPDEHWVLVEYETAAGRRRETRIPWRVRAAETTRGGRPQDPVSTIGALLGIDAGTEAARQIKRALFAPRAVRRVKAHALRSVVAHATRRVDGQAVGYLRIFSFNVSSARLFAQQLAGLLTRLPLEGLVVDIRGNPGGHIGAAEALLQLLSDRPVVPAAFSLATTPMALELCRANPAFSRWTESVRAAVETGELYSQAFPLSDPEALTEGLPHYAGPKVLITDALCYSAADIFAAGFQDNRLGPVLGTDRHTGAGGANVWTHDLLHLWLDESLGELPSGAGFRVAVRRATRVNANAGVPLEDLGVRADAVRELTRRDLTGRNRDLVTAAARMLAHGRFHGTRSIA